MSSKVVGNAASIMSVQVASYMLPLVNVPYLLRVLGPDHYGLIAFSQAVMMYFVTLNDYGFNLSATRELAICRNDSIKVSELYSSVMCIKALLCLVSFAILSGLVIFIPRFHSNWPVYFASFLMVIGNMLFPQWYFQGVEKMYWISVVNLTSSLLFTAGIFILVHKPSDFLLAAVIQSGGKLISGIFGVMIVLTKEQVKLVPPRMIDLRNRVADGWHLFMSQAAVTLYTSSTVVVLGFLRGMAEVGYFSAAYKILAAGQGLVSPMCQAMYPHVCSLAVKSQEAAILYLKKAIALIGGITLLGGALVFVLARLIVRIAMGPKYMAAVPVLQFMSMIPFACAINNIYGTQCMLNFGMKKQFSQIIIYSGFLNVLILVPLAYWFGAPGAAASALIIEVVITVIMAIVLYKRSIHLLPTAGGIYLGATAYFKGRVRG